MQRIARIATRNHRSLYSYLFREGQFSKFFELAVENLFQVILDDVREASEEGEASPERVVEESVEPVDFDKEVFDPFNVA